jgi:cell fate regulator YaaT (PSP1 superfamily)
MSILSTHQVDASLGEGGVAQAGAAYMVSHGKSGGFGRFIAGRPLSLKRGDRVVVRTSRGQEFGTVLCPATGGHAHFLADAGGAELLRQASAEDNRLLARLSILSQQVFEEGRQLANQLRLPLAILDVDLLLDGQAIIQFLGEPCDFTALTAALESKHRLSIRMENLALPPREAEADRGCGKPDCGRTEGGGCTSCGSGGCSSCGSGKVDMKAYFSHLRTKMESVRTPLL